MGRRTLIGRAPLRSLRMQRQLLLGWGARCDNAEMRQHTEKKRKRLIRLVTVEGRPRGSPTVERAAFDGVWCQTRSGGSRVRKRSWPAPFQRILQPRTSPGWLRSMAPWARRGLYRPLSAAAPRRWPARFLVPRVASTTWGW
jgi:hypothetical protein